MKYKEEAKFIWKNYVPKSGQANTVQGELLRSIERLRWEAQNNGNANWDKYFRKFTTFIWKTLKDKPELSREDKETLKSDLDRLRNYCEPYLEDDLYDRITDLICKWYISNKEPIIRDIDNKQIR